MWPFRRGARVDRPAHLAADPPGRQGDCDRPPVGWTCPRGYGHDGPCAAVPVNAPPRMPHCDSAVLHAPGECAYCDAHPDWQQLRQLWGIAFTGHAPKVDVERPWLSEVPCPSDARRPGGANQVWPGNRPEIGRTGRAAGGPYLP